MDLTSALRFFAARLSHELFSPGSIFSVYSLAVALCLAVSALAWRQHRRRGRVRLRALRRAMFNKVFFLHPSVHADVKLFILCTVVIPGFVAALTLSTNTVAVGVEHALVRLFGARAPVECCAFVIQLGSTLALFLAYEIGYWVDHYLKHRVSFLWELHKLHHTAEVLTPLTNFRNHPIDSIVFGYMLALFIGAAAGLLDWLLGRHADVFALDGRNILFILFLWTIGHLQHSQFWIPIRGFWGHVVLSPAHHQIHHSSDPKHFNRNFGSFLALWDWLAGTLEMPAAQNPRLAYGVGEPGVDPHGASGMLVTPAVNSARALWRALRGLKDKAPRAWHGLQGRPG